MGKDRLYRKSTRPVPPFTFNAAVADVFDDMIRRSVPMYDEIIRRQAQLVTQHHRAGTRIYDLGCSTGNLTVALCRRLPADTLDIVAVDNAAPMLAILKKRLEPLDRPDCVSLLREDIRRLVMHRAGVVAANFTLQFIAPADRDTLLQRIYEALVPGGLLLLSEKTVHADPRLADLQVDFYYRFKQENGYSALEISQKMQARIDHIFNTNKKGQLLSCALDRLPAVRPSTTDTDRARIRIGHAADLDANAMAALHDSLCGLKPWRKGPFDIFGVAVDGEWDSSIKWGRLAAHLGTLAGKRVLDIGSSSGYYMFRMASRQPRWVLGLEPYLNYYFQFLALARYIRAPQIHCLPLKLEALPVMRRCFDVVLCMGILYHRRSPLDTLLKIHGMMPPGGQLVLETLILEGSGEMALCPRNRYAKMKNIYFIPTLSVLTGWLVRTSFDRIRCVDVSPTTLTEQRQTDWIDTESLADFLDPENPRLTVEGYPAPLRAMVIANTRP